MMIAIKLQTRGHKKRDPTLCGASFLFTIVPDSPEGIVAFNVYLNPRIAAPASQPGSISIQSIA